MNIRRAMVVIGWATLVAGGLDCILPTLTVFLSGGSVTKLWQFVASGLLGQDAYSMGTVGILYGVLFHFLIMAIFSAFVFLVYKKRPIVDEKWALCAGLVYGAGMWFVMNMLVLPLSRAGNGLIPFKIEMIMNRGFIAHMIFGAIIVLVVRRGFAQPFVRHARPLDAGRYAA